MFNIVAGSKIDEHILSKTAKRYFGSWMHISHEPISNSYNIIVEECKHRPVITDYTSVKVCIENHHPFSIARAIEYGRAYLRLYVTWNNGSKTYSISRIGGEELEDYEYHPAFDVFVLRGIETLLDRGFDEHVQLLVEKKFGGLLNLYSGSKLFGRMVVYDKGLNIDVDTHLKPEEVYRVDTNKLVEENRLALLKNIAVSKAFLKSLGDPDRIVVSFSGGKDSLVALHLATEYYGAENIDAIYVDTGVDFPDTRKYVEKISSTLGVSVHTVYAPVKDYITSRGLPTKTNRWCTLLKTVAFKKKLKEITEKYRKVLVIVGDRDVESEARARKPPVRKRKIYLEAAPIKQWSTLMVQLYIWYHNLPENPVYINGFYRLGCYICPALTSLEKQVMIKKYYEQLKDLPWFEEFIRNEIE